MGFDRTVDRLGGKPKGGGGWSCPRVELSEGWVGQLGVGQLGPVGVAAGRPGLSKSRGPQQPALAEGGLKSLAEGPKEGRTKICKKTGIEETVECLQLWQ